jgi:hypothetical protein
MAPGEDALRKAMDKYTHWIDNEILNLDHSLDPRVKKGLGG